MYHYHIGHKAMMVAAMPSVLFYFSGLRVCLAGFLLFEHSVGMGYQIFSIVLQTLFPQQGVCYSGMSTAVLMHPRFLREDV